MHFTGRRNTMKPDACHRFSSFVRSTDSLRVNILLRSRTDHMRMRRNKREKKKTMPNLHLDQRKDKPNREKKVLFIHLWVHYVDLYLKKKINCVFERYPFLLCEIASPYFIICTCTSDICSIANFQSDFVDKSFDTVRDTL